MEIERLSVAVVLIVHPPQIGIGIQHRLFRFRPVVLHKLPRDTDPAALIKSRNLNLGIVQNLFRARLDLTGLNVQPALKNMSRTKRPNTRLIPLPPKKVGKRTSCIE